MRLRSRAAEALVPSQPAGAQARPAVTLGAPMNLGREPALRAAERLALTDGAGPAGAGSVLVRADDGGVDEMQVPVDLALRVGLGLHRRQDPVPDLRTAPAVEPARHDPDRPVALRQVAPGRTGAVKPQDAVRNPAMVVVRPRGRGDGSRRCYCRSGRSKRPITSRSDHSHPTQPLCRQTL